MTGFEFFLFMVVSPSSAALMIIFNIVEIWFIIKHKILSRVKSTVYILNLAVSDIILGLFIITVKILKSAEKNHGVDPKYRLFFQLKMIYISLYVSVLSIAALTIERFLAVKKPFFYNLIEYNKKCIVCVVMWLITILAIILHNLTVNDHEEEYFKTPLIIFITAACIGISYVIILRTLKQRSVQLAMQQQQIVSALCKPSIQNTAPAAAGNNTNQPATKQTFNKSEKRFLSYCIKSFIIFLVCWLPLAGYGICLAGGFITDWKYKNLFDFITHIIAFWNSIASPVMFLHHNRSLMRKVAATTNSTSATRSTAQSNC